MPTLPERTEKKDKQQQIVIAFENLLKKSMKNVSQKRGIVKKRFRFQPFHKTSERGPAKGKKKRKD
ncbi:hypothetical protein E2C01_087007 [Portunus trituberculatus]|uniref:Uncharacterized protein n=1 Tax=Portunus trituberculatus TaxID=210409 RepID=A0A5B7J2A6_PORTR|nr:hypothetical protein [Portunus trituberculatus]